MSYSKSKNPVGRPLKYKTPAELQAAIDAYFDSCWEDEQYLDVEKNVKTRRVQVSPYTMTGLGLAIGLCRQGLINYGKKDKFHPAIANARRRCEEYAEKYLYSGKNPSGAMFIMRNNWGWVDKKEHDVNIGSLHEEFKKARERAEAALR